VKIAGQLSAFAVLSWFSALPAQAFVWNEVGDAGDTPSTVQITASGLPGVSLTQINGHLDFDVNAGSWDVDLYAITITDPQTFSASTVGSPGNIVDPVLFLFDAFGRGVYMNDDHSVSDLQSTLPAGMFPGLHYLAVAWTLTDPQDGSGKSIFPYPTVAFDSTGVYQPLGPGGANALGKWSMSNSGSDLPSDYSINLTGAAAGAPADVVPEPGTVALLLAAAGGMLARRRRTCQATR
jgi:PEP-CTERM motif-containing protein